MLEPKQILVEVGVTVKLGAASTLSVTLACPLQACASIPLTVYVVVVVGKTFAGDLFEPFGLQTNVVNPVVVNDAVSPEQIVVGETLAVTTGKL